jgi:predicted O-linked N-acetylglucosamine transferase (SPINDLY family)
MDASAKIEQGIEHHKRGGLQAAEALYSEVLAENPQHPDAHNLLANLYHHQGDNLKALYHSNQAIALSRHPQFLNTRGSVFIGMKRYQEAVADLRAALKAVPDMAEAHSNLCLAYCRLRDYRRAVQHGQEAVRLKPDLAIAWSNLGTAQQDAGDSVAAVASYRRVLEMEPGNAPVANNLGWLQYHTGDFPAAAETLARVPQEGWGGLELGFARANALLQSGRTEEAALVLEESFRKTTDFSPLMGLLGQDSSINLLSKVGGFLAIVLGQPQRAVVLYERCLQIRGDSGVLWNNLGSIYFETHQVSEAMRCYRQAIRVEHSTVWAHSNLGLCHIARKESPQAIAALWDALTLAPDYAPALGWMLREKTWICDWERLDEVRRRVSALAGNPANTYNIAPLVAISVFDDPMALRHWAEMSARELFQLAEGNAPLARAKTRRARKKIRIGYYSFDFRNHPVAHLTARLFELHDKSRFEVYIYSYGPDDGSEIRRRIERSTKHFADLMPLSVLDTARRIAEDDLDILIDLTGNTLNTRSQIMAYRPARIQAHWLGFIGTMGSSHYDYLLADDFVAPPGSEEQFTEKPLRLPRGMHIMDDSRVVKGGNQTRAGNGLPEKGVVFGCFCQSYKIQPETFARWMDILKSVPRSVLWLASGPDGVEENLRRTADAQGVDPARLVIAQRCGPEEYLSRLTLMDLYLDTYPYTSGTTASDALISGCPVLTLAGRTMVSRMAASILHQANMDDLVCDTPEAFVALATRLGNDAAELARVKERLAEARRTAPLFDVPAAVRGLEEVIADVVANHVETK